MLRQFCIWAIAGAVIIIPSTLCWSAGAATLQRGRPNTPYAVRRSVLVGANRSTPICKN